MRNLPDPGTSSKSGVRYSPVAQQESHASDRFGFEMAQHQLELKQQDAALGELETAVTRLGNISLEISNEITQQNRFTYNHKRCGSLILIVFLYIPQNARRLKCRLRRDPDQSGPGYEKDRHSCKEVRGLQIFWGDSFLKHPHSFFIVNHFLYLSCRGGFDNE